MGYPNPHQGHFVLDTDACDVVIGTVLSQIQNGLERVLTYGSRTINETERNYCVTNKELLAVRYFREYFKVFIRTKVHTADRPQSLSLAVQTERT